MIRRVVVVAVLALIVVGLFRIDSPNARPGASQSSVVGPSVDDGDASVWFCPGAPDDANGPAHQLVIANPGDELTALVTVYGATADAAVSKPVTVPARSQHVVALLDVFGSSGSTSVEISGGSGVTVAHRLLGSAVEDQSGCSTEASAEWHFASANSELVNASTGVEAVAHLWLVNPFPADASVDIRVARDDQVRIPTPLRGLIVPARSARMVDLTAAVERKSQFAFSVEARGGRIVAELVQTVAGRGLMLEPGVPSTSRSWMLADSFGGTSIVEALHVYNPTAEDATVAVSVYPNEVDAASLPEPFVLEVPARRFAPLVLTEQPRVPPDDLRWVRVDVVEGPGVVIGQVLSITGAVGDDIRPSVAGGLATSTGVSAQADRWYLPFLSSPPDSQPAIVVANPSESIALVSLTRIARGERTELSDRFEVPPRSSLVIDLSAAATDGPIGVELEASQPVVVSARTTSVSRADLSLVPGVPARRSSSSLPEFEG